MIGPYIYEFPSVNTVSFDFILFTNIYYLNSMTFLSRGFVNLIHIAKKQGKHFQSWLRICLKKKGKCNLIDQTSFVFRQIMT